MFAIPAIIVLGLCAAAPQAAAFKVTGLSLGAGNWITVTGGDADSLDIFSTLPSLGVYGSGWGLTGYANMQGKSVFKRTIHTIRYSLGDADLGVGKKLGPVSTRLLLRFPLYSWSVENSADNELFIGSGNIAAGGGLGGKLPKKWLPGKMDISGDIEVPSAVTKALAEAGSVRSLGIIQASHPVGKRWKAGINSMFLFDYWKWIPGYWDQEKDVKFTIMPGIFTGVRLPKATYVDLKGGVSVYEARHQVNVRPSGNHGPQTSFYLNLSLFQGL